MHIKWQFHRKWNTNRWNSHENGCLRAIPALLDDSACMAAGVYKIWYHWTLGGEIPKENTAILSDLFCKINSRKGANVQITVSWVSQPVAQSGFTSICSNPSKDEEPLFTWTGLTVRATCSGLSSGEQKSGAELVIQQKRLMLMDGVCSLSSPALPPQLISTSFLFPLPLLFHVLLFKISDTIQIPSRITKVPATTVV